VLRGSVRAEPFLTRFVQRSPSSALSLTHSRRCCQFISGTGRTILIDTLSPPHYTHDQTLLASDPAVPSGGHRHATHHPHAHRHPCPEHPRGTPCRRHVALLSPAIASRATTRDQGGNMPIDAPFRLHYGIGHMAWVCMTYLGCDVPGAWRCRRPPLARTLSPDSDLTSSPSPASSWAPTLDPHLTLGVIFPCRRR
jgi:hypothetical protein